MSRRNCARLNPHHRGPKNTQSDRLLEDAGVALFQIGDDRANTSEPPFHSKGQPKVNILHASRKPFAKQTSLLKLRLLSGTALASDETGIRVGKSNWWL